MPLENPAGENRLSGTELRQRVARHFGLNVESLVITARGQPIPNSNSALDSNLSGQLLLAHLSSENPTSGKTEATVLPDQP